MSPVAFNFSYGLLPEKVQAEQVLTVSDASTFSTGRFSPALWLSALELSASAAASSAMFLPRNRQPGD